MLMRKTLFAAVVLLLLAACGQTSETLLPPGAGLAEAAILEEGGNINLALREAQNGMGPSVVGDPTAVYGKIMTYSAAVKAAGSTAVDGESQAWKFDRPVYLYLFEGDITDADPRTSNVTDWAQKAVILDAETGSPFMEITHRAITKVDVFQFLPLLIRDNTKGVPPREIKSLNRPPVVAVEPATAAPKPPSGTPTPNPKPTTPNAALQGPPSGPGVEVGKGYTFGLYVHCGIRDARFDGRLWMADPMLSDGSGNPPLHWTPDDSVGIMQLVSEDRARFTSKSGRMIEFKPWPADVPWRPCV